MISQLLLFAFSTLVALVAALPAEVGFQCTHEGRFEDIIDCGSYVDCVADREGRLMPYKRSCHGRAFDPSSRRCTRSSEIQGCKIRQARHYEANPRFESLCSNGTLSFACGDCQTLITCLEKQAFVTKCESDLRCVSNDKTFGGGVCHVNYDDRCRCLEPSSYRQDPYFNGTFFLCSSENAAPKYYNCPNRMSFHEKLTTCVNNDGSPPCTESGIFTSTQDCSKYYSCTLAQEGWIQTAFSCPKDQLYNEETEQCEDPCVSVPENFRCQSEGRFADPKDCSKFYECIEEPNGEFIAMSRRCPLGFHWKDDIKSCIPSSQSQCKVQTENPFKKCSNDIDAICRNLPFPESDVTVPGGYNGFNSSLPQIEERPKPKPLPKPQPVPLPFPLPAPEEIEADVVITENESSQSQPDEAENEVIPHEKPQTEEQEEENAEQLPPEKPQPEEQDTQESKPEQPHPEQPQPEEVQPEKPQPEESQPEQPKPEEAKPQQPQPDESQPEQPQPEEAKPEQSQPEESQPDQPLIEEEKPEHPQPEKPQPEEPQPEEAQPEQPQPTESQPEESESQAQPEQPQPAESQTEKVQPIATESADIVEVPESVIPVQIINVPEPENQDGAEVPIQLP